MKNKNITAKKLVQFAIIIAVITATSSCMSNGNSTEANNKDSVGIKDNTMTTATNANEQNNQITDSAKSNTSGDAAFLMKVAEINMEEIKLGKLAQQKGSMAHVKELGKMMVTEHTKAMADVSVLAKSKTVILPSIESDKIKDAYKTLATKSGKDFDKAYSDMMVNGHKEAIALFEKTNMETKDADVKAMTTAMIPKLKTHLDHAEMCQKECDKM